MTNNVGWSVLSKTSTFGLKFVTVPILARILSPQEFGVVAVAQTVVMFLTMIGSAGLAASLILEPEEDAETVHSVFWVNLAVAVVMASVIYVWADLFAGLLGAEDAAYLLRIMALLIPLQLCGDVAYSLLARRMAFHKDAAWSVFSESVGALTAVGLALLGFGIWSLVAQLFVSAIIRLAGLFYATGYRPRFVLSPAKVGSADEIQPRHHGLGNLQFHHLPVAAGGGVAPSRPCRCRRLFGRKPLFEHSQPGASGRLDGRAVSGLQPDEQRPAPPLGCADAEHAGLDRGARADDVRHLGGGGTGHVPDFRPAMGACLAGARPACRLEGHHVALQHLYPFPERGRPLQCAVVGGHAARRTRLRLVSYGIMTGGLVAAMVWLCIANAVTLVFYSWAVFRTNGTAFFSGLYITTRPLIASIVMAVAVRFLLDHIKADLPHGLWSNAVSQVAVGALAGAVIYGVLLLLTERDLLKKLRELLRQRRARLEPAE